MRRTFCIILIICVFFLPGCSAKQTAALQDALIYATFYPIYAALDMVCENVGGLQTECLVQPQDGCLRDYQLSDWDYALLQSADTVIAGGRGLESFEETLYSMGSDGPAVSTVLYNMELAKADIDVGDDEDSHWADANPHIYMKIDGMTAICESVAAHLSLIDPSNQALYMHNLEKTENRLKSLHAELHEIAASCEGTDVIVMNEALIYTAEEFGLNPVLCVNRDSGEAYYDAELDRCIEQLRKCGSEIILIEKQAPKAFVDALEAEGYSVAKMDIMSTHHADEGSEAYFAAQRENAYALQKAVTAASAAAGGNR